MLPRAVVDALESGAIRARARAAGVTELGVDWTPIEGRRDRVRVRCSVAMAGVLVEECTRLARMHGPTADRETRVAYGCAIATLYAAVHDASRAPE